MSEEILTGGTSTENAAGLGTNYIVAASQKASTAYVKQVAANLDAKLDAKKVDKSAYDAKIAEIEETLSNSASGLGERVEALEAYDKTVPGLISTAVGAEETRATGIEGGLRTDVDANTAAIAKLNGAADTAGSVAKAVADEAALRVAADEALDARLDVIEGSGEGSVAKALADAKAYTDGKETTLQAAIDGKVDKSGTDRLMTVAEGEKLAALPTNADLTSALGAKANAADVYAKSETYSATEVDGKIAPLAVEADVNAALALKADAADVYTKSQVDAKVASVFRYMGSADSVAALEQITAPAVGDVYQVGSEEYVRTSGGTWERLGTAVDLSPYSTTVQMNSAISAAVLVEENRAKGVESGLDTRLTAAEGDIDALEGRMDTAEAAIGTVDSRIATAKGEAIADAGTAADGKISTAIGALTINGQSFSNSAVTVTGSQVALGEGFTPAANGYLSGLDAEDSVTAAIDAIDQALTTVTGGTSGEGGSIAALQSQINTNAADIDAIEALLPKADFAGTTVKAEIAKKVDAVAGSSLVADTEITKLAAYPAYSVVEGNINAKVTAKADKQPVVSSAVQTLEAGKRYVVTGAFEGTLPADAATGSTVEIFVLVGGTGKTVAAPAGETILGQNLPCAIGISEEGWQLDNESYIFVKNGTNWHVL